MTRLAGTLKQGSMTAALLLYSVFVIGPMVWLGITSLRTTQATLAAPFSIPHKIDWTNYGALFGTHSFWLGYLNSAIVVGSAIVVIIAVSSMAGYGFARFEFPGKGPIYAALFAGMLLPPQLVIVPLFIELRSLHLIDTRLGLSLVYAAFALPVSIYILRRFYEQLPESVAESARLDGASEWTIFWRIMFPMARPATFTVLVLQFALLWNEFVLALIILERPGTQTLPVTLSLLQGEYSLNIGAMAAGLVLSVVPLLLVFLIFSDKFLSAMTAGAVRG